MCRAGGENCQSSPAGRGKKSNVEGKTCSGSQQLLQLEWRISTERGFQEEGEQTKAQRFLPFLHLWIAFALCDRLSDNKWLHACWGKRLYMLCQKHAGLLGQTGKPFCHWSDGRTGSYCLFLQVLNCIQSTRCSKCRSNQTGIAWL